jgi:hypothetical protein
MHAIGEVLPPTTDWYKQTLLSGKLNCLTTPQLALRQVSLITL